MAYWDERLFFFLSLALPEDTFSVASFTGIEGISRLYEFDITLVSDNLDIDIDAVLKNTIIFKISKDEKEMIFHGIPAFFELLKEVDNKAYYRTLLVPRIWLSNQQHENQLFLDKSVPEIIEEIFKQAGLTPIDYEFKLTRHYKKWEYICQFRETDLHFISRWMEREGIYYFFEQTDNGEKIIVTDTNSAHRDIPFDKEIYYSPPSALVPVEEEAVQSFVCHQKRLPNKVVLKDYNYRKPSLDIKGEAIIDPQARGTVYLYGEHFKTPEEGNELAKIRAEEIKCRQRLFFGESTCPALRPGYLFKLEDHFRQDFNQKYLVVEIEHRGSQSGLFLSGFDQELSEEEKELSYSNSFVAIPADVQFRPERKTEKPRFYGTMNAKIDAAGDGKYAEIDKWGRYKVRLPFDLKNPGDGKASRWIRMAQPYSGAGFGMHFPLHKGTEVLLTFVDGDPDRPIIASSVPNPETMTPVTEENATRAGLITGGGNQIIMEDKEGGQRVVLSTPSAKTSLFLGAGSDGKAELSTEKTVGIVGKEGVALVTEALATIQSANSASLMAGNLAGKVISAIMPKIIDLADKKLIASHKSFKATHDLVKPVVDALVKAAVSLVSAKIAKDSGVIGAFKGASNPGACLVTSPAFTTSFLNLDAQKPDIMICSTSGDIGIDAANNISLMAQHVSLGYEKILLGGTKQLLLFIPRFCSIFMTPGKLEFSALENEINLNGKKDELEINIKKKIKEKTKEIELEAVEKAYIHTKDKSSNLTIKKGEIEQKANKKVEVKTKSCSMEMDNNKIIQKAKQKIQHKVGGNYVRITNQIKLRAATTVRVNGKKIDLG